MTSARPPHGGSPARAEAAMVFVVLIWGANFSFIKWALSEIPPFAFGAIRFSVATCLLLALLRWREGPWHWPRGSTWPLIRLGLLGNTVYQTVFILGVQRTTAANAALMVATTPVIVAVLGTVTGIERVTRRVLIGIALAFSGVSLVLGGAGLELSSETLVGDLLVLLAATCWAVYTLGVVALPQPMSSLRLTALTMVTGTPLLVLLGLPELLRLDWHAVGQAGWVGTGYATFLALVLAYVIWNRAVRVVGGARTALFGAGIPVVAMVAGWALLEERPGPVQFIGTALIVSGVVVARGRTAED